MSVPYPLINGVRHSWASIEIQANGRIVLGITEINYSTSLEPGVVRGAGTRIIALTQGTADQDGDFTILLEEYNVLVDALGEHYLLQPFDIVVSYSEEASGLTTIVDTIQGARITKVEASNSATSTDGSVRKCTIKPMGVLLNGVEAVPAQPTLTA